MSAHNVVGKAGAWRSGVKPVPGALKGSANFAATMDSSMSHSSSASSITSEGSRKHFDPKYSGTYQWRPHAKSVKPVAHATPREGIKKLDGPSHDGEYNMFAHGRKHFPGMDGPSSKQHDMLDVVGREAAYARWRRYPS